MNTTQKNKSLVKFADRLQGKRIVFSDEGNLHNIKQFYERFQTEGRKPYGLWYSIGNAWIKYVTKGTEDKSWTRKRLSHITHIYEIILNKNLLYVVDSKEKYRKFRKKYETETEYVKWNKIENKGYAGFELHWQKNYNDVYWSDGFSCSSGCIWGRKAIKEIKLLKSWNFNWSLQETAKCSI